MNTEAVRVPFRSPTPGAERMRLHRKRRRSGLHYVRIELSEPDIDGFISMGLLKKEQRREVEALQTAVLDLIYRTLDDVV